jgi:hypothetical protein
MDIHAGWHPAERKKKHRKNKERPLAERADTGHRMERADRGAVSRYHPDAMDEAMPASDPGNKRKRDGDTALKHRAVVNSLGFIGKIW